MGPMVACLVLGGIFLLIITSSQSPLQTFAGSEHNVPGLRVPMSPPEGTRPGVHRHKPANWPDAGLERALPLVLLGAFAMGLVLSAAGELCGRQLDYFPAQISCF